MKKPKQKTSIARRTLDKNRQSVSPLGFPRTFRGIDIDVGTTLPAGKVVPVFAQMLFREDAIRRGGFVARIKMRETQELLMNATHLKVETWFAPFLAFERFNGSMDTFNDSYAKQNAINFFEMEARGAVDTNEILKKLGRHAAETDQVNTCYVEAYNLIDEYKRINRSEKLPIRARLDKTLAPAYWKHTQFSHIVAEPAQAIRQGEVALRASQDAQVLLAQQDLPVVGVGVSSSATRVNANSGFSVKESDGATRSYTDGSVSYGVGGPANQFAFEENPASPGYPHVRVSMPEISLVGGGVDIGLFLADIEAAKKSVWYAQLREQYAGISEEYIIDLLMQGIAVPEQVYKQPIRLASTETVFGMRTRYAQDGANLDEFVADGAAIVQQNFALPRMTTGGIIMILVEVVPDQIFERKQDPSLFVSDPDQLPNALRDDLDQDKIDVVKNKYVDVMHGDPDTVFGYEPQNAKWNIKGTSVGGRYFRPLVDLPADENRMKIWSVETANPTLTTDFILVNDIHTEVFQDPLNDPFEFEADGQIIVEGNTQFGPALLEEVGSYQKIVDQIPDPVEIPQTP